MVKITFDGVEANVLREILKPETDLEDYLIRQPEIQTGMAWGVPRFGHPEGEVWRHVVEVLENVDQLPNLSKADRRDLRLVTLTHDTFKYAEDKREPRDWTKHHGVLARKFVEGKIRQPRVLDLIEWHDEAYYCWRLAVLYKRPSLSRQRLDALLDIFEGEIEFYFNFFVCDTRTGDKNLAPLKWFSREVDLHENLW